MEKLSLDAVAREHLAAARRSANGRAADTVYGGADKILRQTLLALTAGTELAEHESPGEATLLVLQGAVLLHADGSSEEGADGDLLVIPPTRHSLEARTDAVVLLTVAKTS